MTEIEQVTVALSRAANREDRGLERRSRRRQLQRLRDMQREAQEAAMRRAYYCDPEDSWAQPTPG